MNLFKDATISIRSHTRTTSAIITAVVMILVSAISITYLSRCSRSNDDPDYLVLLDNVSSDFKQYSVLPEDNEYRDKDLKAMIWDSKDIITTGTYQNATTYRVREGPSGIVTAITTVFLKQGFTCGALTPLAGKYLDPAAIPHVYQKGNTLIHIMRYWAPILTQDHLPDAHVWRITIIQYRNVTQTFYPCQGNGWVAVGGINTTLPVIKHQDGHVTIDHTHSNEEQKSGERLEKNGYYKNILTHPK